ncbi:hypothetical protein [Geomicrobium sediminis]|uniref:YVTN family beta-propeller protein n=1 Tax=Geomicrobium sediminis TaxID=1347788 RepID=A0ABS2P749_9BACL|nr:hypothetical protein [Geomicrobium sediminis]MBM7631222.1 YVTN family beta-propeller protein [Geomicrobium sediminis]
MSRSKKDHCHQQIVINNNLINGPGNVPPVPTPTIPPEPDICGKIYVADGRDRSITVLDVATGEVIGTIPLSGNPFSAYVNQDKRQLYVIDSFEGLLEVIDVETDEVVQTIRVAFGADIATNLVYDPVQEIIYVAVSSGIRLLDANTFEQVGFINTDASANNPYDIARDPVTGYIYATNSFGDFVYVIDGSTIIGQIPVGQNPNQITIDPTTRRAYVSNHGSRDVSVIDLTTSQVIATITTGNVTPYRTAVDVATNTVYTALNNGTVAVIDGDTNTIIDYIDVGGFPRAIAINAIDRLAYVSNNLDNTVSVIDLNTREVIATIPVGNGPYGIGIYQFPC